MAEPTIHDSHGPLTVHSGTVVCGACTATVAAGPAGQVTVFGGLSCTNRTARIPDLAKDIWPARIHPSHRVLVADPTGVARCAVCRHAVRTDDAVHPIGEQRCCGRERR